MQHPARPAAGVHRASCPPARVVGRPVRPHARSVHRDDVARRFGVARRAHRRCARRARGRRPGGARRVPTQRRRPRVLRRRRAPPVAPSFAGDAATRGRAGRAGGATPGSSRRGTASPASAAASTRWSRRSGSCRVQRWWPRRWRPSCCRLACARYRAADLDELCTTGDVVWVGAGAIGASDGRIRLYFADQFAAARRLARGADPPDGPLHDAIRAHLASHGASFWNQLRAASPATPPMSSCSPRCGIWCGPARSPTIRWRRCGRCSAGGTRGASSAAPRGRPRPGRLTRIGPPAGAGRWSLVAPLRRARRRRRPRLPTRGAAAARALRRGHPRGGARPRVSRAGYAAAYGVLKVLEERGQVRRGYFVAGLGAAQFAAAGRGRPVAVGTRRGRPRRCIPSSCRRRSCCRHRSGPAVRRGARLAASRRAGPAGSAGAVVVLRNGVPLVWFDRRSSHLVTFPASVDDSWAEALATLVKDGRQRSIEVRKVNGEPIDAKGGEATALLGRGFRRRLPRVRAACHVTGAA